MRRPLLAALLLALAAAPPASASRRFTGTEGLRYEADAPLLAGARTVGVAFWVQRRFLVGPQAILALADAGGVIGLSVRFDDRDLVLSGADGAWEVRAALDDVGPQRWFHVAADVELPEGGPPAARVFVNGRPRTATASGRAGRDASPGWRRLDVGNEPRPSGETSRGLRGDLHDVSLRAGRWPDEVLPMLQRHVARDVTGDLAFTTRLGAFDAATGLDPDTPLRVTVLGATKRGLGPPLRDADRRPTVLVIGDTQHLDDNRGCWPPCSCGRPCDHCRDVGSTLTTEANAALGQFVVDYREALRIRAVFHVGDWVAYGGRRYRQTALYDQTCKARALADKLNEAGVPWSCTMGNHDYEDLQPGRRGSLGTRGLRNWSRPEGMPPSLFTRAPWHVATMRNDPDGCGPTDDLRRPLPRDADYAHAFAFRLDDDPASPVQLGVSLPLALTETSLAWLRCRAERHAAAHPGGRVWLVTHLFLFPMQQHFTVPASQYDGDIFFVRERETRVSPRQAWLDHLQHVPNLGFVFSGHYWREPYAARHRSTPLAGGAGEVHQLLVNAQQAPRGGDGFLQILATTTGPGGAIERVDVETYLPLRDEFIDGAAGEGLPQNYSFTLGPSARD